MKTGTSLTDAEIIKAFECCSKQSCEGCPYNDGTSKCLMETLPRDTLDLINRQRATINRLKAENKNSGVKIKNQREQLKACNEKIKEQQAEIERLENKLNTVKQELIETIPLIEDDIKTAKSEAYKEFVEAYKNQIKNYTGMFTDEGFYVSLEAVLSAVDFIFEKLKGDAVR